MFLYSNLPLFPHHTKTKTLDDKSVEHLEKPKASQTAEKLTAKQQLQKESCITQDVVTSLAKFMKELPLWTGWSKSKNAESP